MRKSKRRLAMGEKAWSKLQQQLRNKKVVQWRIRTKLKLIEYKGGKCQICNYDKLEYPSAFCFHHINPEEKEFGITAKSLSFDKMKKEVDKCQLLCVRCHAETHDIQRRDSKVA